MREFHDCRNRYILHVLHALANPQLISATRFITILMSRFVVSDLCGTDVYQKTSAGVMFSRYLHGITEVDCTMQGGAGFMNPYA